ncbi:hypothetical protein Efla_004259 [Eimeria flavescens]
MAKDSVEGEELQQSIHPFFLFRLFAVAEEVTLKLNSGCLLLLRFRGVQQNEAFMLTAHKKLPAGGEERRCLLTARFACHAGGLRLTLDFQINKKIAEEVALIPSKRVRNKVAGFITHLMKRIQKGPVRGISLKLQEEERERRMDFVPDKSELDVATISIDQDTAEMLQALNITLPNVAVASQHRGGMGGRGVRA